MAGHEEKNQGKRRISCIVCPMSCVGEVELDDGQIVRMAGFTCKRGQEYARNEVTAPKRMMTTTVRITGGALPLLPVISKTAVPKDKVVACARCLSATIVKAPVKEGDIIYPNILNLGVDIVATRDIDAHSA